jgi:hypothetical protein
MRKGAKKVERGEGESTQPMLPLAALAFTLRSEEHESEEATDRKQRLMTGHRHS